MCVDDPMFSRASMTFNIEIALNGLDGADSFVITTRQQRGQSTHF